ncbi:hypothetical protein CCH79_00016753, partial [Gambusia affinis]
MTQMTSSTMNYTFMTKSKSIPGNASNTFKDSRETVHERTIHVLLRKMKPDVAWPRLQKDPAKPSWISVDFDNWRDWEHEEDEGKAEYDQYMD